MLQGTYTALITPFNSDGTIDFGALSALIEYQIEAGVAGIVPVGTTGESPTLTHPEHRLVIEAAIEAAGDTIQVIAGSGSNATAEAVELTRHAMQAGATASLQITPYYNKPNQEGLYRHFSTVADLGLPIVLYNVPGRTSCEIGVDTVVRLAEHPKVTAIKEAGGSVDRVSAIRSRCNLTILSGDDALTLPMLAVGGNGVISVASNLIPKVMNSMVSLALDGQWDEARAIHLKHHRLFGDLFIDTNPLPIKAAMAMVGLTEEVYRLPLVPMDETKKQHLRTTLQEAGVL